MRNPFAKAKTADRKATVHRQFMAAAEREHPSWWSPELNPGGPESRWEGQLADWTSTLARRAPGVDPLDVMGHLLKHWPGGVLAYNAGWASGQAQGMGLLDECCRPVDRDDPPVDDETRRRGELLCLGGAGALAAYDRAMRGGREKAR